MHSVIARMAELSSPAAVLEIGTAAPWVRKWSSAVGTRTTLGWVLDTQRALARADRPVARPRVFESGVESARSALLRFDRSVLDRPPIVEHLSRVLHGSVSTAPARTADPVRRAASAHNSRMFCAVSSGRLSIAMDARGTTDRTGDHRLRLRDVPFRRATFRCAFTVSFPSGSRLLHSDKALGSLFCADCWRRACVCRGYSSWSGRVSRPVGRSLVSGVDCIG